MYLTPAPLPTFSTQVGPTIPPHSPRANLARPVVPQPVIIPTPSAMLQPAAIATRPNVPQPAAIATRPIVPQPAASPTRPAVPQPTVPQPAAIATRPAVPQPARLTVPQPAASPTRVPQPAASPTRVPQPAASPTRVPQPAASPTRLVVPQPAASPTRPAVPLPTRLTLTRQTGVPLPALSPVRTVRQEVQGPIEFTPEMIDESTIVDFAMELDQSNFSNLLNYLSEYYHNDTSLVSDETYDELIDIYEAKYAPYDVIGAEPRGEKVALPYFLGSLGKIKKERDLANWIKNHAGPYIIQDKVDGLTLLFTSTLIQGRRVNKLYTRGRGYRGVDVSHLLDHLRFPPINQDIAVRGEVVMSKEAFQRVGTGFKNARNMASGIVMAKKQFDPAMARELSFYAYRILTNTMTPEQDIQTLQILGFLTPNPVSAETLSIEILENYYKQRRLAAPYEMDGLVIYQNVAAEYPVGENPSHVMAFKTEGERAITTVTAVIWEASKDRRLKPVVHYDPVPLSGAMLKTASGYNARYIVENNIGPGAKVVVTRVDDVNPKVLAVLTPSPSGPMYPDPNVHGSYDWNETGVELVLSDDNDQVFANKLHHFLTHLGVQNTGPGRLKSLVQAGIRNIPDLLRVTPQQLDLIPGIGDKLANQLYNDLHAAVTNVSLPLIMDASGIFPNIGQRRFEAIVEVYPNLLDMDPNSVATSIQQIKGFKTLAFKVAENLPLFKQFLADNPSISIRKPLGTGGVQTVPLTTPTLGPDLTQTEVPTRNLTGMTVVFSGFRDKNMEERIKARGGRVTSAVSGNTTFLILKNINDRKGKAEEAEKKGVRLISRDQFESDYLR